MARAAPRAGKGFSNLLRLSGQKGRVSAVLLLMAPVLAGAAQAQDLEAAKSQFMTSCGVCHALDPAAPARQGPPLAGIFGRKAGQHPGFKYSDVLRQADWVWNEATLDPWIENAQAAHPGTIMNYRQADPEKRARIIAYLKSLSQP